MLENFCSPKNSIFHLKADIDLPDEDLAVIKEKIDKECEARLPEIRQISGNIFGAQKPVHVSCLKGTGTFHSIYQIDLGNGKEYVLRLAGQNHPLLKGHHFIIDRWAMQLLKNKGLPNLDIFALDISLEYYPFGYEIIEKAKGESLEYFEKNDHTYKGLVFSLGRIFAKIHAIEDCSGFGFLDINEITRNNKAKGCLDSWKEYIFLKLDDHIQKCLEIGAINSAQAAAIKEIFLKASGLFENIKPSILHADLKTTNIFSDGKDITAIIDWEDCVLGDPIFDIASFGSFLINEKEDRVAAFCQGYQSITKLPDDFELKYWLYYLRIVLAKTVHRHRFKFRELADYKIKKGLEKVQQLLV